MCHIPCGFDACENLGGILNLVQNTINKGFSMSKLRNWARKMT